MNNKKSIKEELELNCKIIRNQEIDDTDLDGETVMMDLEKGQYYALNEVGSRIWELAKNKIMIKDIVKVLFGEYDVNEQECTKATLDFVKKLYDDSLIEIID